jgi:hypothetical protein
MFMKKLLFVLAIAIFSVTAVNAQQSGGNFHFGGGLRLALPTGDLGDIQGFGIGAELQGELMFSDKFSGTITTGYTSFTGKDFTFMGTTVKGESMGYIPILAGVRVYPSQNFFIGGKLGYGILTGGGSSEGAFNYEPQIGFNAEKIQIALGYNALSKEGSTLSHLGLSAIYKFN